MMEQLRGWKHVFKLDPDKELSDEHLDLICTSGTDAVLVGGSDGVTFGNTVDLLARIRRYEVPCALEVSDAEAAVPGFDLYLIPFVLNSDRAEWMMGYHQQAVKQWGKMLPWDAAAAEGYIILNEESKAARLTEARGGLDQDDVLAYVKIADRLLRMPIVYIEYSGRFGDMELLQACKSQMRQGLLFYGGGIDGLEKAAAAAQHADTIVVGNIVYENIDRALETVQVKQRQHA